MRSLSLPARPSRTAWISCIRFLLALSLFAPLTLQPSDARAEHGEYDVKAAFVLNFALLTKWPSGAFEKSTSPIVFCIVGEDREKSALEGKFEGRSVGDRPVNTRPLDDASEMAGCHLVFITKNQDPRSGELLAAAKGTSVLTVGESEGFARRGGIINFYTQGAKIRFEINHEAAEREKLQISSRLLRLARIVSQGSE